MMQTRSHLPNPRRIAPLVALVLVVFAGAASAQTGKGRVMGRVVSDSTQLPVPGATVFVVKVGLRSVADTGGHYNISGLLPGDYLIVASLPGRRPDSMAVYIPDEGTVTVTVDFVLRPIVTQLPAVQTSATPKRDQLD